VDASLQAAGQLQDHLRGPPEGSLLGVEEAQDREEGGGAGDDLEEPVPQDRQRRQLAGEMQQARADEVVRGEDAEGVMVSRLSS